MKKIFLLLVLSVSTLSFAQSEKTGPPAGNAEVGDFYGGKVSAEVLKNAVSARQLERQLQKTNKIDNVVVKGKVTEVCDKKGCWMTVQTNSKNRFFVKMKDYAFFLPLSLRGKEVVLKGDAELKMATVEELKHYAEDAKKSDEAIAMITKPAQEINFIASSVTVVE